MTDVDLKQLAIARADGPSASRSRGPRRQLLTRYVVPGGILSGFVVLIVWMAWGLIFPPRDVTVVALNTTTVVSTESGQPVFQASGWVEPRPTPIRVAALEPGVIEKMMVREDDEVTPGQTIAVMIKDDARLVLEAAEAQVNLSRAEATRAEAVLAAAEVRLARPVHLEAPLRAAEGQMARISTQLASLPFEKRQAEADLAVAQADHTGKVAARGVVAEIEIEKAKAVLEGADAKVRELDSRMVSLRTEQNAWKRQVQALRARLELLADETEARDAARAAVRGTTAKVAAAGVRVAEAGLKLSRMTVVAKAAGRVYQLVGAPGARVGEGMTQMQGHDGSTVVTLYQPGRLQARVDVRFGDLPQVAVGQSVRINNPALNAPLVGRVLFVSSMADIQKNTLEVKVEIQDPPAVFKPDMQVDITFLSVGTSSQEASKIQQARHYIPRAVVHTDSNGSYVWLADRAQQRARRVSVTVGAGAPGGLVEISGELTRGRRVISGGSEGLVDGEPIRILRKEPEAAFSSGGRGVQRKSDGRAGEMNHGAGGMGKP